jgi:hypothetical protein
MAYNDFTLEALKEQFGLRTDEQGDYFAQVPPVTISESLRRHLSKYVPLALNIGTEKARSELIIAPVLLEVIEQFRGPISFFSGVEFSPDPDSVLFRGSYRTKRRPYPNSFVTASAWTSSRGWLRWL